MLIKKKKSSDSPKITAKDLAKFRALYDAMKKEDEEEDEDEGEEEDGTTIIMKVGDVKKPKMVKKSK